MKCPKCNGEMDVWGSYTQKGPHVWWKCTRDNTKLEPEQAQQSGLETFIY